MLFQGLKQYIFSFISGVEIMQFLVLFQGLKNMPSSSSKD